MYRHGFITEEISNERFEAPSPDSTEIALMRDVLGSKLDNPVTAVGVTASIVAYVKGILQQGSIYTVAQNQISLIDVGETARFQISLINNIAGPIPSGDITEGTYDIIRVRAGVPTTIVSGLAPSKANGSIYINYGFPGVSWQANDVFLIIPSGISVVISGTTYYPAVFTWAGTIDNPSGSLVNLEIQDVVIYPVAEDIGTTVISDDSSNPPAYPLVAHITSSLTPVVAWQEDIDFEQSGIVDIISIFAELKWKSMIDDVRGHSYSKVQISKDGGANWIDMTDVFDNQLIALTDRIRIGVGQWISDIDVGTNKLQMRLVHYVDNVARTSSVQIRSDSYIRVTYRKS